MTSQPARAVPLSLPSVPLLCPNGTVLCIATGPSLTQADVDFCRGKVDITIAVNRAYELAPWADILYACDGKFWKWHHGVPTFTGLKFALQKEAGCWPNVQVLRNTGDAGIELDPTGLRNGRNSGYQAIGVAKHLGAKRIILLGYDMGLGPHGEKHCHRDHPDQSAPPFLNCRRHFEKVAPVLSELGIDVINCSRRTAIRAFRRLPIAEALA